MRESGSVKAHQKHMLQHDHSHAVFGVIMMILASVCFSTAGVLSKLSPWSALSINGARDLIASMVIGVYLIATHHRLRINRMIVFGAVCMFGVTTLFIVANKMTTAANAIVLQYTAPVWIMIFVSVYFRKKPARLDVLTMAVVMTGILCFFVDGLADGRIAGDLIALASGVFYAGLFLLNSLEGADALSSMFFGQLAAGIILTPFAARETDFSARAIIIILVFGIVQVGLAYIFFYQGTKHTAPVTASLINGIEPILNPVLAAFILHERLKPLAVTGAVIVIAALFIYNLLNIRKSSGN